jgi:hypothetical protein
MTIENDANDFAKACNPNSGWIAKPVSILDTPNYILIDCWHYDFDVDEIDFSGGDTEEGLVCWIKTTYLRIILDSVGWFEDGHGQTCPKELRTSRLGRMDCEEGYPVYRWRLELWGTECIEGTPLTGKVKLLFETIDSDYYNYDLRTIGQQIADKEAECPTLAGT